MFWTQYRTIVEIVLTISKLFVIRWFLCDYVIFAFCQVHTIYLSNPEWHWQSAMLISKAKQMDKEITFYLSASLMRLVNNIFHFISIGCYWIFMVFSIKSSVRVWNRSLCKGTVSSIQYIINKTSLNLQVVNSYRVKYIPRGPIPFVLLDFWIYMGLCQSRMSDVRGKHLKNN